MPVQNITITSETTMADLQEAMSAGFRLDGGQILGGTIEGDHSYNEEASPDHESAPESSENISDKKLSYRDIIQELEAIKVFLKES